MKPASATADPSRQMDERSWWDKWNTDYRAEDNQNDTPAELFALMSQFVDQISDRRPSSILEIACGTGTLSRRLKFAAYHGLDISPAAIAIANQKTSQTNVASGASSPTYESADFHVWPLPRKRFDIVLCVDAIAGIRDQQSAVNKMAEAATPGGAVILATPNPFVYHRIRRVGGVKLENGPVSHWLPRRELHDLIRRAGLTLERSFTIMPRGNMGVLRLVNSPRLNGIMGQAVAQKLRTIKERAGIGQYRVVVARKSARP